MTAIGHGYHPRQAAYLTANLSGTGFHSSPVMSLLSDNTPSLSLYVSSSSASLGSGGRGEAQLARSMSCMAAQYVYVWCIFVHIVSRQLSNEPVTNGLNSCSIVNEQPAMPLSCNQDAVVTGDMLNMFNDC